MVELVKDIAKGFLVLNVILIIPTIIGYLIWARKYNQKNKPKKEGKNES